MGIFSKKANDELFELLEADAKKVQESNDNKIQPSYVITADEVLAREESPRETKHTASSESPLEALKKRMLNQSKEQTEEKPLKNIEKK